MQWFILTLSIRVYRPTYRFPWGEPGYKVKARKDLAGPGEGRNRARPADVKRRTVRGKTLWMKDTFARHLRHVARLYSVDMHKRGMPVSDNDRWHQGKPVDETSADHPAPGVPQDV